MSGILGAFQGFGSSGAGPVVDPNTAAWFGGGYTFNGAAYTSQSTTQRITFATDTAASSVRGPLSSGTTQLGAAGNTTDGWFGGGRRINVPSPTGSRSTVDRITYATDTATASVRGPLSSTRYWLAAAGNTTDGWFGGGQGSSRVDRITYASDTATASVRGPLSEALGQVTAAGNTTDAWFGGGYRYITTVSRITYTTDTATASVRGPLSDALGQVTAAGNTTDAWFGGGYRYYTTVSRITYTTDTATASVRGPLSIYAFAITAAGNTTDAWFAGGRGSYGDMIAISNVQRITYATDTAATSTRGPLNAARYALGGASNATDGWFGGGTPSAVSANLSTVSRISYATDTATASVRGPLSAQARALAAVGGIQ